MLSETVIHGFESMFRGSRNGVIRYLNKPAWNAQKGTSQSLASVVICNRFLLYGPIKLSAEIDSRGPKPQTPNPKPLNP